MVHETSIFTFVTRVTCLARSTMGDFRDMYFMAAWMQLLAVCTVATLSQHGIRGLLSVRAPDVNRSVPFFEKTDRFVKAASREDLNRFLDSLPDLVSLDALRFAKYRNSGDAKPGFGSSIETGLLFELARGNGAPSETVSKASIRGAFSFMRWPRIGIS